MPSFQRFITASSAVIDVLKELSQPYTETVAASSNTRIVNMWHLASLVGPELAQEHPWSFLNAEYALTTDGSETYDLPDDFDGFIGSAAWNQTSDMPIVGDANESAWQRLNVGPITGSLCLIYRLRDNQIEFLEEPTAPQSLILPYRSRGWARDGLTPFARRDNLETDEDTILFDGLLFKSALKLRWLREKRFDTASAEREYLRRLNAAISRDSTGETVSLLPVGGTQFLSTANLPETGYGS